MSLLRYVLAVALLLLASQSTDAQFWPVRPLGTSVLTAPYTGPGDCSGCTPLSWWFGLRAYSAATAGTTPAVNICSESGGSDVTCEDEQTSASTGKLVLGTVGSACSSVACTFKIWYDPTENNYCSSAPCNYTQTTVANRATFLITGCPLSGPCAQFAANTCYTSPGSVSTNPPMSFSTVFEFTNAVAGNVFIDNAGNVETGYFLSGADAFIYAKAVDFSTPATASTPLSVQTADDSAVSSGSVVDANGTSTTGTLTAISGTLPETLGAISCSTSPLIGYLWEGGFVNSLFTGGNMSSLTTNQRTFWGF